jgi:hypothetical protein
MIKLSSIGKADLRARLAMSSWLLVENSQVIEIYLCLDTTFEKSTT